VRQPGADCSTQPPGAVPLTAEDLPGYPTRLYDAHLSRPEFVRLAARARLERLPTRELVPDGQPGREAEVATIADAWRRSHVDPRPIRCHDALRRDFVPSPPIRRLLRSRVGGDGPHCDHGVWWAMIGGWTAPMTSPPT